MSVVHFVERLDGYGDSEPLVRLVLAQVERGDRPVVVALTGHVAVVDHLRRRGIEVHIAQSRWPVDPFALARTRVWLRRSTAALHVWGLAAAKYGSLFMRRDRRLKIAALPGPTPGSRVRDKAVRSLRRYDVLCVFDDQWRGELAADARGQIRALPRTVAAPATTFDNRESAFKAWGVPPDARVVVTAGPLVRRRRLDDAIWNFELVRVLCQQAVMIVAGDGPDMPRLRRFVRSACDPGAVQLVGHRSDWRGLLPFVDAYWEAGEQATIPQAVCEALAVNVPCVLANGGAAAAAAGGWTLATSRAEFARETERILAISPIGAPRPAATADARWLSATGRTWGSDGAVGWWDDVYRR
ncbi:MAG: glycosyltransferase [Planctomycetales bacterium]|nr:glycosyltransferase [Planctomycetales bacterium]